MCRCPLPGPLSLSETFLSVGRTLSVSTVRKMSVVLSPVIASVKEIGGVGFLNLDTCQSESHFRDLAEHDPCQILDAGGSFDDFESQLLTRRTAVFLQCDMQRIVSIDQHSVIVLLLEPWFNFVVKISKQRADVTVSFDFEMQLQAVAMPVDIAAFVLQCFVAMSCIKFVLLFDDHGTGSPGGFSVTNVFYGTGALS